MKRPCPFSGYQLESSVPADELIMDVFFNATSGFLTIIPTGLAFLKRVAPEKQASVTTVIDLALSLARLV